MAINENLKRIIAIDENYEKLSELELSADAIGVIAEAVEELRMILLFAIEDKGFAPMTSNAYLKAIAHLELAHAEFDAAAMHQAHAVANCDPRRVG